MDSALASDNELQIDLSLILFQTSSQEFMSSIFMSTSRDLKFIYLKFKIKFLRDFVTIQEEPFDSIN